MFPFKALEPVSTLTSAAAAISRGLLLPSFKARVSCATGLESVFRFCTGDGVGVVRPARFELAT